MVLLSSSSLCHDSFKNKYHQQKGVSDPRPPCVGDIVALANKPRPVLARIDNIDSDHTVTLYTGKRYFQAPVKELMLIQPNDVTSVSELSDHAPDQAVPTMSRDTRSDQTVEGGQAVSTTQTSQTAECAPAGSCALHTPPPPETDNETCASQPCSSV